MPSPFPGMNPYLEQNDTWEDFHTNFITRAQEALSGRVGSNYLVKIEVRLLLHELSAAERRFMGRADVGVTAPPEYNPGGHGTAFSSAPVHLQLPAVDVERQTSLEILDRRSRRVVTVIELLSPSNKTAGPDRDDYMAKRRQVLAGTTHLVEIDLRRGGTRPDLPRLPLSDYYMLVSRYAERPRVGFWPVGLRDALPVLPIPLTAPDADIPLDIRAVLNSAYDAANYWKYIYQEMPEPPLSPDDEAWAKQFVPRGG
jgi:hypothetical protein